MTRGNKILNVLVALTIVLFGASGIYAANEYFRGKVYFKDANVNFDGSSKLTFNAGTNFALDATTGTKIGTATSQKLGFFNATPVVQQLATADLGTALSNLGLRAAGTAYPITTSGAVALTGTLDISSATVTSALGATQISNRTRYVDLPLAGFHLSADGTLLTAATVPGYVVANGIPALEWAQSETALIAYSFRVPADYASGSSFICTFSLDATTSDTTVDFDVWVNTEGSAFDAAVTDQTPVAIADNTTTNQAITLTVATDTFVANDLVTFEIQRAAGTGAGSNLNLLGCKLSYTADM